MREGSLNSQPASLVRFVFKVPGWQKSLAYLLVLSFFAGIAVFEVSGQLYEGMMGLALFGVPGFVAGAATPRFANALYGRMTRDRSFFLALIATSLMWVLSGAGALFRLTGTDQVFQGFALSLGAVLALRLIVMMAVSDKRLKYSLGPAAVQPLVALLLLPVFVTSPVVLAQVFGSLAGFGVASYFLVIWLDAPMRRAFGVSGLDLLKAYVTYRHEGGNEEMEALLDDMGEEVSVPVTVVDFTTLGGRNKAFFVSTFLHPGPVGEIGGGNLPFRLASSLEDRFGGMAMVFHGAATHDFNMVSQSETRKVLDAAADALDAVDPVEEAGRSTRAEGDTAKVLAQCFGSGAVLVSTNFPEPTEDLEFSIGYSAVTEAKARGLEEAMFADAHNSHGKVPATYLGSSRSYDVIRTCSRATEDAVSFPTGKVLLGTARGDLEASDIGGLGMRAAVVDVSGQRTAYVLIDGNNMVPGLRDEVLEGLPVDEAEVVTTDNHVVNMNGDNPVGSETDRRVLVEEVRCLVEEAIGDMEPVMVGMATEQADDVKVFGSNRTSQIATTLNAMLTTGGGLALAYLGFATLFTLVAFFVV